MATDNKASYAKIGLTVVLGVAAIVATLIYVGGVGDVEDMIYFESYSDKSVSGLSVGSPVCFRGVKIGEVREINFVGNKYDVSGTDNQQIYILMGVSRRLIGFSENEGRLSEDVFSEAVRRGLRATVTASGITGLSRVEFDMKRNAEPAPKPSWQPKYLYVPSAVSLLDSFSDSATKVMNQINRMDITSVWSNLNHTVESLARITDSVKVIVESRNGDLERVAENVLDASASLKAAAEEIRRNPSLLVRERKLSRLDETE